MIDFLTGRGRQQPRIMSACFKHNNFGTWFHPSSRKWFELDHVIASKQSAGLITNVQVMPGYIHNTDHRCLKISIRFPPKKAIGRYFAKRQAAHGQANRLPKLQVGLLQDPQVQEQLNNDLLELGGVGLLFDSYSLFSFGLNKHKVWRLAK